MSEVWAWSTGLGFWVLGLCNRLIWSTGLGVLGSYPMSEVRFGVLV